MAQSHRVLLWAVVATAVLAVVDCTCHEQGSEEGPAPVITSVVANRDSENDPANVLIEWTDEGNQWDQYVFFFGLQTMPNQECISAGSQSKHLQNGTGTFSTILHHTLDPFVKYTVQVAQDWAGSAIGRKSQAFEFTLSATLKYEETTETSVRIHWPKPASTETNITGFIWEYSTEGLEEFNHTGKSPDLSSSITSAVLDGLEEGTQYNIWVKAAPANPTVESETLMHIVKTLPSKPAKPQNLTCMNVTGREGLPAIAVSWQAPPARDRNGDITEYKIKFNVDSPHTNPQVIPVTVEEDESNRVEWNYTIPGVQPGVRYIVGVAAATEAGTGDYAETVVDIPAEAPSTQPTQPKGENATKTTTVDNSALLFIVIPVGFTIIVLGGIIVVTVCILIRVKRMATKAARSLAIAQSQLTQQEANNYTATHIYEDPEAVLTEYRGLTLPGKESEANNHTPLPFAKEAFIHTTNDRLAGGYAILEPSGHFGDSSRPSISDSEASSFCESFLQNTSPADYEKPCSTTAATHCDDDPTHTHSHGKDAAETSTYTDLLSTTMNTQDYETPVFQNGNATCASPV